MKLSKRQKAILYGLVLGDGYLQKTGKQNARLRIEHSYKQREYVYWKYKELQNLFASKPKKVLRIHPKSNQKYTYLRLQSHSSPLFGRLRRVFYEESGRRKVSQELSSLLNSNLTLAVWYMDDGYYCREDKSAHLYLSQFSKSELECLIAILQNNYGLQTKWYCHPVKKSCQLNFTGEAKNRLFQLVKPYILPCFNYKIPLTP